MAYAWSFEENGNYNGGFESNEEALKEARKEANHPYYKNHKEDKPTKCFIGEQVEFKPEIDIDTLLDRLQEAADDFGGEYADDYLRNVTDKEQKDLKISLQKVYDEWEEKTKNKATFFKIENSKEYSLEVKAGEKIMEKQEDKCELCHNALQCLAWEKDGMKAKCDNWGSFKRNYVNGPKGKILSTEMKEIEADEK